MNLINRHIRHLFYLYSKNYPFCSNCRILPDCMQISDNSDDQLPEAIGQLKHLEDLQFPYTAEGSLMQCGNCNAYYWYQTSTPGGSEDAMKTTVYESIRKIGFAGVWLELTEAREAYDTHYKEYKTGSMLYHFYNDSQIEV